MLPRRKKLWKLEKFSYHCRTWKSSKTGNIFLYSVVMCLS